MGAAEVWDTLPPEGRNSVLRALLDAVVSRTVGRGRRVPVEDRVAIYRRGSGLDLLGAGGGRAGGIRPLPVNPDHPGALGV